MVFSGCVPPIQYSPACQSYEQLVKESWSYDKGRERYSVGGSSPMKSFKRLFNEKECIYGATKPQVKRLLGAPSLIEGGKWRYYMGDGCANPKVVCEFMQLSFDGEERVTDMTNVTVSIEH